MQFTVIPASSQTCTAAIRALLAHESGPTVVGVCRSISKLPEDIRTHPNFLFTKGDPDVPKTLDFSGSAGVLVTTPASFANPDTHAYTRRIAGNVRNAISESKSVGRLVYISSLGAQHGSGVGEVKSNHDSEAIFKDAAAHVTFVRNAYFMDNWGPAVQTAQADSPFFYSCITPVYFQMRMVSARDIGRTCAAQLLQAPSNAHSSPRVVKVQGPRWYSTKDVQAVLETLAGRDVEVKSVPQDGLSDFFAAALPAHLVQDFVDMTTAFLPGGLLEAEMKILQGDETVVRGQDDLSNVLGRIWAAQK